MCAFSWDSAGVCELKREKVSTNFPKNASLCLDDNGRGTHLSEDGALSGTETEGGKSLMRGGV
jgi:hypothetical protein